MTDKNRYVKDDVFYREGERFGNNIVNTLSPMRIRSVTIDSIDAENNVAMTKIFEEDEPMPVPLTLLNVETGIFRMTPKVGSIALIGNSNSNEDSPFFVSFSELDKVEIFRGGTTITITLDPEDEEKDEISVTLGQFALKVTKDNLHVNVGEDSVLDLTNKELNVKTGESTLQMNNDIINFNGGGLDGLVKINEITQKLNDFVNVFNSHTHNVPPSSFLVSATGGVPNPTPVGILKPNETAQAFKKGDYENEKIKQ